MSGVQFGDPKELRPVALGEAPFGIRLYDSRPDGRPPVSEKMLHQAPWMSGAQFGDPKELRPVALGEAPFGIRLYDSRPDGRPPVSEKMLNQTMKGLDFSACQIGSDRRCATRTGHGEPVGPDHSLEFRRHKSRLCRASVSSRVRLGATARAQPDRSVGCSSARTSVWTSGGSSPGEGSHSDLGVKGRILPDGATRD
ncbi:uncharacterized protein [Nerophis lumbriciformis]|uniref:uncharacterized protein isoform X3 n=1 Tax=Nerophis lumbriciformis TaxID=546530 RepID=UPI003BAD10D0